MIRQEVRWSTIWPKMFRTGLWCSTTGTGGRLGGSLESGQEWRKDRVLRLICLIISMVETATIRLSLGQVCIVTSSWQRVANYL